MAHARADDRVGFLLERLFAEHAIFGTCEGITPMKTHGWLPLPITGSGTLRANLLGPVARGMLILALALGSIGIAGAAVMSGHGNSEHARAYHAAGNTVAYRALTATPWMY